MKTLDNHQGIKYKTGSIVRSADTYQAHLYRREAGVWVLYSKACKTLHQAKLFITDVE